MIDCIVIDEGNSRTKVGFFHDGQLQDVRVLASRESSAAIDFPFPQHFHAIWSSVRNRHSEPPVWLPRGRGECFLMGTHLRIPMAVIYDTPETLGYDRLANAVGAVVSRGKNVLVGDCGSCLTFTSIVDGTLCGGSISPGMTMRFKSLHEYTGELPLVDAAFEANGFPGKNTTESISVGVLEGITDEIEQKILRWTGAHPEGVAVLTGGDAPFLSTFVKSRIFVDSNLTLLGLYEILKHQID